MGLAYLNLYNLQMAESYLSKAFFYSPHDKEIIKALARI